MLSAQRRPDPSLRSPPATPHCLRLNEPARSQQARRGTFCSGALGPQLRMSSRLSTLLPLASRRRGERGGGHEAAVWSALFGNREKPLAQTSTRNREQVCRLGSPEPHKKKAGGGRAAEKNPTKTQRSELSATKCSEEKKRKLEGCSVRTQKTLQP